MAGEPRMTHFNDLLDEVIHQEAHLLSDTNEEMAYGGVYRRLIVQRSGGGIWEAWRFFAPHDGDEAREWSIPMMQAVYMRPAYFKQWACNLDSEALYHWCEYRMGADERYAAIEAAEQVIKQAQAS